MATNSLSTLFKKLTKSASTYNLSKLDYVADPRARRDDFIDWIEKLQEVTYTESATEDILADFPILSNDTPEDVNKIFAQLLLAYITRRVKDFMSKDDKGDGVRIIK